MTDAGIDNISKLLAHTPTQKERFRELMQSHSKINAAEARTPLSPMKAAAAQPRKFAEISGLCRSLGFRLDAASSAPIDIAAMEAAFSGRDIDQRARAKAALYQLGLIPA